MQRRPDDAHDVRPEPEGNDVAETKPRYPSLAGLRVREAMHRGVISCAPGTSLRTVARMMATSRVHAVLVRDPRRARITGTWRVITDMNLLEAAEHADLGEQVADGVATTPAPTVDDHDDLAGAVRLMVTLGLSHLIVVARGKPIGVLSTLDVSRALAGFPERHPARF